MKGKRLFSAAVAGTLVAAQMVMPVMAADGGEVDVDVVTKKAIIRVEVPTTLAIAVNQFEKEDEGSQIFSDPFTLKNKSEIPVKVSVASTANLASTDTISLVATKKEAEDSTSETGEAWIAVAAQTSDGKYIEEDGKGVKDLTEAAANVTTFVQGTDADKSTATADQVFYLDKAASDSVTYKGFVPSADGKIDNVSYAQFYKLTEITLNSSSEQADLEAAIANGDVYQIAKTVTDLNGAAITLTAKKGSTATVTADAANNKYYSVASEPTVKADLKSAEEYVYGENAEGGKAAFRYIGRLSESKEIWTATDISKIHIAYDITGVTASRYGEVEGDCTYGLYSGTDKEVTLVSGKDNSDVVLKIALPKGKTLATNFASINGDDASKWSSFKTNVIFNTTDSTVTIKAAVFSFGSVQNKTTDHKYTFTVKDTEGASYSTDELDLTP